MLLLTKKRKILWLGPKTIPGNIASVIKQDWSITKGIPHVIPQRIDDEIDLILIFPPPGEALGTQWLKHLLDKVNQSKAVAIFFLPKISPLYETLTHHHGKLSLSMLMLLLMRFPLASKLLLLFNQSFETFKTILPPNTHRNVPPQKMTLRKNFVYPLDFNGHFCLKNFHQWD